MSGSVLAIYRLPIAKSAQIGTVRVVLDRHQQVYIEGSKVVAAVPSTDFLVVTLANEQVYYVKAADYQALQTKARKQKR